MKFRLLFIFIVLFISVNGQVGIGTPTPDVSSILEINSSDKGILVPRISLTSKIHKLNTNTNNAHALLVFNIGTILPQGFYYWKSKIENNVDNGSWIAIDSESSPKFFYMPSIILPINATNTSYVTYTASDQKYTVDLYLAFKAQFDTPIKSSNGTAAGLQGFVLARDAYEYHIIYADETIFPHTDIIFIEGEGNEGKFTYKVNPATIINTAAFMNIVLKVK